MRTAFTGVIAVGDQNPWADLKGEISFGFSIESYTRGVLRSGCCWVAACIGIVSGPVRGLVGLWEAIQLHGLINWTMTSRTFRSSTVWESFLHLVFGRWEDSIRSVIVTRLTTSEVSIVKWDLAYITSFYSCPCHLLVISIGCLLFIELLLFIWWYRHRIEPRFWYWDFYAQGDLERSSYIRTLSLGFSYRSAPGHMVVSALD